MSFKSGTFFLGIVSSLVLVLGGRIVVFYMHSLVCLLACVIDFEDPLSSLLFLLFLGRGILEKPTGTQVLWVWARRTNVTASSVLYCNFLPLSLSFEA